MAVQPRSTIKPVPMPVRQLPEQVVNRIAAGEVVERPERGEGTRRKRHRCRRQPRRHLHRWRRPAADRHHRRRQRHDMAISRLPSTATPPPSSTTRISCAFARWGSAARPCPRSARWRSSASPRGTQRAARLVAVGRRRREITSCRPRCRKAPASRSAISLRDARAAEIPQDRPHRGRSDPRSGAAAGDGAARYRLHARRRGTRAGDLGRARRAGAAGRLTRLGDILGDFRSSAIEVRRARRRRGRGLCRSPSLTRANALGPSVRQRPPGARQADPRRGARGLFGLPAARPPSVVALFVTLEPQEVDANVRPRPRRFRNAGFAR